MRIIIGTNHLYMYGGTESHTLAMVQEAQRRGIEVDLVCPGPISTEILKPFEMTVNRLHGKYDAAFVSHKTTVRYVADNAYCDTTIQTIHGTHHHLESPSVHADKYVVISESLARHHSDLNCKMIRNGIDLVRFRPVGRADNRRGILIYSLAQSDAFNRSLYDLVYDRGVYLIHNNKHSEGVYHVHNLMQSAGIVIGIGRSAYEGMASGCAVLLADDRTYQGPLTDGWVTPESYEMQVAYNCSGRLTKTPATMENIGELLDQYTPEMGAANRQLAEKHHDIRTIFDEYLEYAGLT